ncbi:MAG: chemotaxis protein CheW [Acidobacteria bacterium]|nr:chemotaxis protein CheW [Acidobacteriota bacterium]
MVDLVKIRKKAKNAKEPAPEVAEAPPVAVGAQPAATPVTPPAVAPPSPDESEPAATIDVEPAPLSPPQPAPASAKPKKQPKAAPKEQAPVPPPREESPPTPSRAEAPLLEPEDAGEDRLVRFKRLAGKRRSWGAASKAAGQEETAAAEGDLELLRFRVAGEDYAVDIDKIVEIVPPRATTRVPNADDAIVGIMSLRGTIVTVIDLRRKLGHPRVDLDTLKDARMIVVERAGETAGFLVDRVSRVVKLDRGQIESHPVVSSQEQSEYVSGVFQSNDGLVILLDIERILAG